MSGEQSTPGLREGRHMNIVFGWRLLAWRGRPGRERRRADGGGSLPARSDFCAFRRRETRS